MLKKVLLLSLTVFLFLPWSSTKGLVRAQNSRPQLVQEMTIEAKPMDKRAQILSEYLAKHNSPMQFYAQDFIEAADKYNIDWKLVPAIAGVESTFGKQTPGSDAYPSYNGWGWGVYGTQAIYFKSWKDGIYTLSQGLREKYIDKGLNTPAQMNKVYAASTAWGGHVDFFLKDIETFAKNYNGGVQLTDVKFGHNQAGTSAQLAFNVGQ